MALPTVDDLKAHINLPLDDTSQDDELEVILDAAVEVVAGIVGPLEVGTVTETHRDVNSAVLLLRRLPVGALSAVSSSSLGVATELTLADYEVDTAAGTVYAVDGSRFYGTFVVEYETGTATLPASVRLAILIVAAHLFETQRVPMQSGEVAPIGFSGGIDAVSPVSRGYALPNRAIELLRPYAHQALLA